MGENAAGNSDLLQSRGGALHAKEDVVHVREGMIRVEVVYASPHRQELIELWVNEGCTAYEAVELSQISLKFAELDLERVAFGVFSKHLDGKSMPLATAYQLKELDRVEIYRPLLIDPKEARIKRVEEERVKKARLESKKAK